MKKKIEFYHNDHISGAHLARYRVKGWVLMENRLKKIIFVEKQVMIMNALDNLGVWAFNF